MTNKRPRRLSLDEVPDELTALALRKSADRLARRDPALRQDLVDLDVAVLRHGQQHVGDLCGEDVVRRVAQQDRDVRVAILQLALELCALGPDPVRRVEGLHPLGQRALWGCGGRLRGGGHGRRLYARPRGVQPPTPKKSVAMKCNFARRSDWCANTSEIW